MTKILVFVFLFLTYYSNRLEAKVTSREDAEEVGVYLRKTLLALDKLTWFLENHYEEGNLDLFIGVRIAESQLSTLLDRIHDRSEAKNLPVSVLKRIRILLDKLQFIADRGLQLVQNSEPEYFERIGGIIRDGVWSIDFDQFRKINRTLIVPNDGKESIRESQSDDCVHNFLPSEMNGHTSCVVTDGCWEMMTTPGFSGYSLTHQVFLLEIAVKVGCKKELTERASRRNWTLRDLTDRLCANVYHESESIAMYDFPADRHDLFLEQTALCGMLGYASFFKSEWLEEILEWQRSNGCYGDLNRTPHVDHYTADHPDRGSSRVHSRRFKRQERRMTDGCSAHRTAVAVATLASYTKFLALFPEENI